MSENKLSMDKIMEASLGEVSNKLTVTFKKTVLIRSYETEVIESTITVDLEEELTAIERMFVTALLQVQMEYTAYCNLAAKGIVTVQQLTERKAMLEDGLYNIKYKADQILGAGKIDRFLDFKDIEVKNKE